MTGPVTPPTALLAAALAMTGDAAPTSAQDAFAIMAGRSNVYAAVATSQPQAGAAGRGILAASPGVARAPRS